MRILVVEDDRGCALALQQALSIAGHFVTLASDGVEALARIARHPHDALFTAATISGLDGIELIRSVRALPSPSPPLIILATATASSESKRRAVESGADDYIVKPFEPEEVLRVLGTCLARTGQPAPARHPPNAQASPRPFITKPSIVGVVIAASTGGPSALTELFRTLPSSGPAAFFVVQHGPEWMMKPFVERLQRETRLSVHLAEDGCLPKPGQAFLAPGDRHLCIAPRTLGLVLREDAPENFVRPAADPLFRTASQAFGRWCVAVVLTGMGCDGTRGAERIIEAGGSVLVQDPRTAVARSMLQAVISAGLASQVLPLADLGAAVAHCVDSLSLDLAHRSVAEGGPAHEP